MTETTRTKAQVVTQSIEQAGLIGAGETQSTEMTTDFGLLYDQLYEELDGRNYILYASAAVPSKYIPYVTAMLVIRSAQTWDIPDDNYERAALVVGADCEKGFAAIKGIDATTLSGQVIPAAYM